MTKEEFIDECLIMGVRKAMAETLYNLSQYYNATLPEANHETFLNTLRKSREVSAVELLSGLKLYDDEGVM